MIGHRYGTFLHLIASTRLRLFNQNKEEEKAIAAIQETQKLTSAAAEGDLDISDTPDYSDDEDMTSSPSSNLLSPSGNQLNTYLYVGLLDRGA